MRVRGSRVGRVVLRCGRSEYDCLGSEIARSLRGLGATRCHRSARPLISGFRNLDSWQHRLTCIGLSMWDLTTFGAHRRPALGCQRIRGARGGELEQTCPNSSRGRSGGSQPLVNPAADLCAFGRARVHARRIAPEKRPVQRIRGSLAGPDERLVPWYQEFYYQVVVAARRVKDPYTGASLYFTPHCFRHSFATALAPLIGGDAKTGAKILGHSPQTFMRYVRANDDPARGGIEKMVEGLPRSGQPLSAPTSAAPLQVVRGGKSSV